MPSAPLRPLLLAAAATLCAMPAPAQDFQTLAGSAVVIDHNTGQTLLEKNADVPLPPASMSKLMTLNMVFEALEDGRLSLDTELPVSEHAASYGGSTMFLDPRDRVRVEDLIRGVIVLSGNDATVVLAEALSPDGTDEGFSRMMTERARELGMDHTVLLNSNGWPEPGHVMSARDLAFLAERFVTVFPQYYTYFAETEFAFDGRSPANRFNRNPLLELGIGADGLKTGHTQEAGYGLVGSAAQGDRRVTFVVSGIATERERAEESERIVNWAFRQFAEVRPFDGPGAPRLDAAVFMGEAETVPLAAEGGITILLPVTGRAPLTGEVTFDGPVVAPVAKGARLATLTMSYPGLPEVDVPLVAAEDVARAGPVRRVQIAGARVAQDLLGSAMERFR